MYQKGDWVLLDPVPRYQKRPKQFQNVESIKAVIYEIHNTQYMYKVILAEDCWEEKVKNQVIKQKKYEIYRKWIR